MSKFKFAVICVSMGLIGLLYPVAAYADAIPLVFFDSYQSIFIALIPIILIEASVFKCYLKLSFPRIMLHISVANLFSAIFGWAIISAAAFSLIAPFWSSSPRTVQDIFNLILFPGFLQDSVEQPFLYKIGLVTMIVGLIPAFFVSVWLEGLVVEYQFRKISDKATIRKTNWKANAITYSLLLVVAIIRIALGAMNGNLVN